MAKARFEAGKSAEWFNPRTRAWVTGVVTCIEKGGRVISFNGGNGAQRVPALFVRETVDPEVVERPAVLIPVAADTLVEVRFPQPARLDPNDRAAFRILHVHHATGRIHGGEVEVCLKRSEYHKDRVLVEQTWVEDGGILIEAACGTDGCVSGQKACGAAGRAVVNQFVAGFSSATALLLSQASAKGQDWDERLADLHAATVKGADESFADFARRHNEDADRAPDLVELLQGLGFKTIEL